jgi:hypothetical protein
MRWLMVATFAACAAPSTPAPQLSNRAAPPQTAQLLRPLVADDADACASHRVTISLDGAPVATVAVACPSPPPVLPNHVVVVESDSWRKFGGELVAVSPGRHTFAARDELTGRSASVTETFPVYSHTEPPRLADSIIVIDNTAEIRISVDVRGLLIFL